jgi:hypothetical protein
LLDNLIWISFWGFVVFSFVTPILTASIDIGGGVLIGGQLAVNLLKAGFGGFILLTIWWPRRWRSKPLGDLDSDKQSKRSLL